MSLISCSLRRSAAVSRSVLAKSPARAFSSSHKPFNHKLKFEDSEQNPDSKKNTSGNSNNTNNASATTSASIKPAKRGKLDLSSEKKFSNFIKEFNRTVDVKRTTLKSANLHSLPRVASTSHLDLRRFRQDILYSGYRPLLLPIKNDCKPLRFDKTGGLAGTSGGSKATYVVPNMWNNSALGTEHFKEMDNIPYRVLMRLKPFQKPPAPAPAKTPRSINSTSEYLTKSSSSAASSSSSSSSFASQQQNQVSYSFEESENENDQQINWKEYFSKRGFKD